MTEEQMKKAVDEIENASSQIEKEQPSGNTFRYYQENLKESGLVIVSSQALHDFFNTSSDANKYLECSQQEDLEREFNAYLLSL